MKRDLAIRIGRIVGLALLFIVLWSLPYGPLFPWSPVRPGYDHLTLARADVYWPRGKPLDAAYKNVDHLIEETERNHGFAIRDRLTVVECADWPDFFRFSPTTRSKAIAAVTLGTGTIIYVTPKVTERGFGTSEFLLHELSHACLYQQSPLWRAVKMDKWAWMFEGMAVLNGRQKAYLNAAEFAAQAQHAQFAKVIGPAISEMPEPLNMRFNYVAWRYFLEYMRKTRGEERFRGLLKSFLDAPDEIQNEFQRVFAISIADASVEFQIEVRSGKWHEETR